MKTLAKALITAENAEKLDDIIFQDRNHEYGAYALRRNYNNRVIVSMLVVLSLASLIVLIAFLRSVMTPPEIVEIQKAKPERKFKVTTIDEIPIPPATDFQSIKKLFNEQLAGPPIIVDDPQVGNEPLMNDDLAAFLASNGNKEIGNMLYIIETGGGNGSIIPVDSVYDPTQVEEPAMFRGGTIADYRDWLIQNMSYPVRALENDLFGTVFVKFTVGKNGSITDVVLQRSVHPILDQAAIEAIKNSPDDWRAARINGYPVNSSYTVPIKFNINK